MSDNGSRSKLYAMPERERLIYNTRSGQSNLIEWNKRMCLFMEAVFGAKASPIFRDRMLPRCMRSNIYVPSPGLPDEDDQSAVANKARELDYSEWRQERKEFVLGQAQMVSTYLTGTLSQSSLDRVKDTRETDMEAAIHASDILEVHKIVWDCHQYRGKTFKVADQQRVQREFTMFSYSDNESLPSLKRRLMELLERMKNYEVSPTPFQIMYTFLMCAARFSNNHVQDICIDYLAEVDNEDKFPLDLNAVYEQLVAKADVVNQVASRNRTKQSHEGSVHQTALRNNIKSMVDKRTNGNKGFRPKGQVNSAYSNINKSVKKKLEKHTLSGKPKNVHTEAYCQEYVRNNPGSTTLDCLKTLRPCKYCKKPWHLDADCKFKDQGGSSKPNHSKPQQKKTFRKKKGKVNSAFGSTEDDPDWVASVFCCAVSSPVPSRVSRPDIEEIFESIKYSKSNTNLDVVVELNPSPERQLVFGSDSEVETYLASLELEITSSNSVNSSYSYSDPGEYSDMSDSDEDTVKPVVPIDMFSNPIDDDDMPGLISNSDSSSSDGSVPANSPQQPQEPNDPDGGDDSDHSESESSESSEDSIADDDTVESTCSDEVIVPGTFAFIQGYDVDVAERTWDINELNSPEYVTGYRPRLAYGVKIEEEFHGWIDMIMHLTGRIPVKPFHYDEAVASELSRKRSQASTSKFSGLFVLSNCRQEHRVTFVGMNVYEFIYRMYEIGLCRREVIDQICHSKRNRRRLARGDIKIQNDINELNEEWRSIDQWIIARIYGLQSFANTTIRTPKHVPGKIWDHTMFRERANLLVQRFNLNPQRTMEQWHNTLCNIVSGILLTIYGKEYTDISYRTVVTFGSIVKLGREMGQDNKKSYGICKEKVNTLNGISHVVGHMRVIRDCLNRSNRDCLVKPDERKHVRLDMVHALTISLELDQEHIRDLDHPLCNQTNVVILELSSDGLTIPNVDSYPHDRLSVIATEDWNEVQIDDEMHVSFYRSEMSDVPRGESVKVNTQYKAEIIIACHQFYVTYIAEIDERDQSASHKDGLDIRDEWYILQPIVRYPDGPLGSSAFQRMRSLNVPDLMDTLTRDVENVPGRNIVTYQQGNGATDSIPGFTRFLCIMDSEDNPHWYFTQKVKGVISVKCEPRMYYGKYCQSVRHHCLVYHQTFNKAFGTPRDAQVFMANNIQPDPQSKRPRLVDEMDVLNSPDPSQSRNLLVAGTTFRRYVPGEAIQLYNRMYVVPADAQQWRQIQIAFYYDNSPMGHANKIRVIRDFMFHFEISSQDVRFVTNRHINIHARYDLPDGHQPFRSFDPLLTDHVDLPGPPNIRFGRDHVEEGRQRRDFYYRQLPNLMIRVNSWRYDGEVESMYNYVLERIDEHEQAHSNSYLSYRDYLLHYGREIVQLRGGIPLSLRGPQMSYEAAVRIHPTPHREDVVDRTIDDSTVDFRADNRQIELARTISGVYSFTRTIPELTCSCLPSHFDMCPNLFSYQDSRYPTYDIPEAYSNITIGYNSNVIQPVLQAGIDNDPQEVMEEVVREVGVRLDAEHSARMASRFPEGRGISNDPQEAMLEAIEETRIEIAAERAREAERDAARAVEQNLRGHVSMARGVSPSSTALSKFDNNICIVYDTMANVSVWHNHRLVPKVRKSNQSMSIDGVGDVETTTQSKGEHPLFGEIWIVPSNSYNILSHHQAVRNGFLAKFSDDNTTITITNNSKNVTFVFERDPVDSFFKYQPPGEEDKMKPVRRKSKDADSGAVYLTENQSMYYTQEQLRKAEIVESIHVALEHPSDQQLTALIMSPSALNMPVTVQDLHNLRAIKGPCNVCLEGRPQPHVGSHSTKDLESEATLAGEELHCDIVFVQRLPRLFTVCHITGYMTFTLMASKFATDVLDAFDTVINAYKSYLKVVRYVSCDHESVLKSLESELNKRGVRMRIRLPYEHEKRAERAMRVVRERMRVKLRELPYKLPKKLYDALAAECIRNINIMPNYKSLPHSPVELVKGDKINYLTDISPPFGSLVLCPTYGEKQKAGSETKQEIAIALGPTGSNMKGGILVYIPGRDKPVVRRNVKSLAMTANMISHMNRWSESLPGFENEEFVFKDTIAFEASRSEDFNQDVDLRDVVTSSPTDSPYDQLAEQEYYDGGVDSDTYVSSSGPTPETPNPTDLSPTMVDISYRIDPVEVKGNKVRESLPGGETYRDVAAKSPAKSPAKPASEHVRRKYGREQHLDPSAIIGSGEKRTTRSRGDTPKVFQMSLKKAIASEAGAAAIEAAKRELKQLVDLKTWVYIRNRSEASPSVHTRVTPCSMFLKQKFNSRGEFLLWKARLVDGGHRTDPTKYNPFEKSSPTTSLEIVYILLSMAVTENMEVESFDVPGAYLNAELQPGRFHLMSIDKSIAKLLVLVDPRAKDYLQPDGSILVEIRRSLYGLPEASKLWYDYFTKALTVGGYSICPHDPCLFKRKRGSEVSTIALYVDDCLHIWKGANIHRELYSSLKTAKLPDLKVDKLEGEKPISFLGLNISRNKDRTLSVNQSGYIKNLLETDGGYKSFPTTPCTEQLFKLTDVVENESAEPTESTPFASLLMKTRYCERTRPDLCLPLAVLQTKMRNPNENDEHLLERCIAYLEGTQDLSMIIRRCDMNVFAYMDAAFAVHGNRVSHSGIHFTLGKYGNTILCKSIKQKTVATSSTEAELICIFDGLDYLIWIRNVLSYLGYPQGTTTIFQDNTSTITMAYMGRGSSGSRTRHIDIKYFHIKQFLDSKDLEIDHLGRDNMTADFFASPRQGTVFRRFRGMIMGLIN